MKKLLLTFMIVIAATTVFAATTNDSRDKQSSRAKTETTIADTKADISADTSHDNSNTPQSTTVYICTGKSATKYHARTNCRGLNNCSGEIKAVSREQAIKMNRTACKICKPQ